MSLLQLAQTLAEVEKKNREQERNNEALWNTEIQKQQILTGMQDGTAIKLPDGALLVEKYHMPNKYNYTKTTTEETKKWFEEHHQILVDDYEMLEDEGDTDVTHYFRLRLKQ